MIGVIADHASRYTWFNQSLAALDKPDGTEIEWRTGANRGASRDSLARQCLDDGHDWIFYIDDDSAFPPDVLTRLLAHDQPVVSALIVQRGAPFNPTAYATYSHGQFQPLDLASVGHDNLVLCAGVGSGGLLVRSWVLRELDDGKPWFLYTEQFGEDLFFSRKCAEYGVQLLVDTGCRIGHIMPAAIFAADTEFVHEEAWGIGIQLAEGTKAMIA